MEDKIYVIEIEFKSEAEEADFNRVLAAVRESIGDDFSVKNVSFLEKRGVVV